MVEHDLEGGLETVSQHRSAVVLLWFGNELEGRRLRRPRYRGENSPFAGHWRKFGRRKRLPSKLFAHLSHRLRDTHSLAAVTYEGGNVLRRRRSGALQETTYHS
jgi:hypothetical protein